MICLQRYIEVTKQFRVQSSTGLYTARSAVYWYHETTYICTSLHYCSLNWVKTVLKDAGINTSVFTVHSTKVCQLQQPYQMEFHCKKSYFKLTGHHLELLISITSDHSHFQPFHRLFSRKLQTYMLTGTENSPKCKYQMADICKWL